MQITIREPGSAITHFIGMMMAIIAATPLMVKVAATSDHTAFVAMAVFIGSMAALYGASALYHSITVKDQILKVFRKLDHMMIFVLIAGSYTPVCLIVLGGRLGYTLLTVVWGIAIAGMTIKACWITCPKWFSSIIYIAMGWVSASSERSGMPCLRVPFCGFWPAALSILWAALSMRSSFRFLMPDISTSVPMRFFTCL